MNPSILVSRFALELGWRGLERTDITPPADMRGSLPVGAVVTCFSTTDLKFFIQINQRVAGKFGAYNVSVVAERYDIGPIDFEKCDFDSISSAVREASRLSSVFVRANFKNPRWRREYLEENPEKLLARRKKWRGWKGRVGTR